MKHKKMRGSCALGICSCRLQNLEPQEPCVNDPGRRRSGVVCMAASLKLLTMDWCPGFPVLLLLLSSLQKQMCWICCVSKAQGTDQEALDAQHRPSHAKKREQASLRAGASA